MFLFCCLIHMLCVTDLHLRVCVFSRLLGEPPPSALPADWDLCRGFNPSVIGPERDDELGAAITDALKPRPFLGECPGGKAGCVQGALAPTDFLKLLERVFAWRPVPVSGWFRSAAIRTTSAGRFLIQRAFL